MSGPPALRAPGRAGLRPSRYWAIMRDGLLLVAMQVAAGELLVRWRIADALLSPAGAHPLLLFVGAVCLLLRFVWLTLGPGWLLARCWWTWSAPPVPVASTPTARTMGVGSPEPAAGLVDNGRD